jgi:DeoR/GlpR family transcriptional regulator of sugar metabolism
VLLLIKNAQNSNFKQPQSMLKRERQDYILRQINLHNKVLSADLCSRLSVSEDTIRRDLHELAHEGKVLKVHGGALSNSLYQDTLGEVYAREDKAAIAAKAATLFQEDMCILVGGGTTIRELLRRIPKNLRLTFLTVNVASATELLNHTSYDVILLGGKVSRHTRFCTGGETIMSLASVRADLCVLGTNAIDTEMGISDSDYESVQIKKAMIKASERVAVLSISEKMGSVERFHISPISGLDFLVTELEPGHETLRPYEKFCQVL